MEGDSISVVITWAKYENVELLADGKLGRLTIEVEPKDAPAGDVMQVLALAVYARMRELHPEKDAATIAGEFSEAMLKEIRHHEGIMGAGPSGETVH